MTNTKEGKLEILQYYKSHGYTCFVRGHYIMFFFMNFYIQAIFSGVALYLIK